VSEGKWLKLATELSNRSKLTELSDRRKTTELSVWRNVWTNRLRKLSELSFPKQIVWRKVTELICQDRLARLADDRRKMEPLGQDPRRRSRTTVDDGLSAVTNLCRAGSCRWNKLPAEIGHLPSTISIVRDRVGRIMLP